MVSMGQVLVLTMVGLALVIVGAQLSQQGEDGDGGDDSILDVCLESHSNDLKHYHVSMELFIRGEAALIPADVGVSAKCMRGIHTHSSDGTLHIETPSTMEARAEHFFAIWDQPFNSSHLLNHVAEDGEKVSMTVDGVEVEDFENHVLADGQTIVIKLE
jgi:hypothetical protein